MTLDISKLESAVADYKPNKSLRRCNDVRDHQLYPALPHMVALRIKNASYNDIYHILKNAGLDMSRTTIAKYLRNPAVHEVIKAECKEWANINGMEDNVATRKRATKRPIAPSTKELRKAAPTMYKDLEESTVDRSELVTWKYAITQVAHLADVHLSEVTDFILKSKYINKIGSTHYVNKVSNYFPGCKLGHKIEFSKFKVHPDFITFLVKELT